MRVFFNILFVISLTITFAAYYFRWNSLGWCIAITSLLFLFLAFAKFLVWRMKKESKENEETRCGNYVYLDYESEPGCWAHNDSLSGLIIYRIDSVVLSDDNNTDDDWRVVSKEESEPHGACSEAVSTLEVRKNGLSFEYNFLWKRDFEWLLQHDFIRMLYDKKYFDGILHRAEEGDSDAQTLIGCCYGHNGKMSLGVVEHNLNNAVSWWRKAAEKEHKYAMRELALYHWHRDEKEQAMYWYKEGNLDIFILDYEYRLRNREQGEVR